MTSRRKFLLTALAILPVSPLAAQEAEPDPLAQYQWVARPLIVFANSERDPRFVHQLAEIESAKAELEDRDVVVILDTTPGPSRYDTTALRQRFRPHDFNVILMGKDGQVKQRSPVVVKGSSLMRTIDRLPIRQQELGRR